MKPKEFITRLQHDEIVAAIQAAEKKTTGEIRVFISRHKTDNPVAAAQAHFAELGMHKTTDRNGVLIFVAPRAHKFAIIGDSGVHARCGDVFWIKVAAEMTSHFKRENFTAGLIHAILKTGELLAEHFPGKPGDSNELSDEIAHD